MKIGTNEILMIISIIVAIIIGIFQILLDFKDDLKDIIQKIGDCNKEINLHYSYKIKNNKITLNSKMYSYSICYDLSADSIYFLDKAGFPTSLVLADLTSFIAKISKEVS